MSSTQTLTEKLNAYVDGELPGTAAAALLRDLAGNPALAQHVSELTALKSTVKAAYDELPCRVPDLDALYAAHDRRHGGVFGAMRNWRGNMARGLLQHWPMALGGAMGVAAITVLLAGWLAFLPAPDGILATAVDLHRQWLRSPPDDTAARGATQLAAFEAVNRNIYIPDLSASELTITRVSPFGRDGVHVGYQGTRGCHLSLFIQPTTLLGDLPLSAQMIAENEAYRWRLNRLDYVLLAVGMDQNRLNLIAGDVYQAVRIKQPFDRQTRMALQLNREQSLPCAG